MDLRLKRTAIMIVPIIIGLSMIFMIYLSGGNNYGTTIFESEQDYKLKFVDSNDYLSLSGSSAVILPFDIISAEETLDGIVVTTYENAVIYAPFDCEVVFNNPKNGEMELKCNAVRIIISGLISGVETNTKILCGQIIGTVKGNTCRVKVFLGTRPISLEELRAVL